MLFSVAHFSMFLKPTSRLRGFGRRKDGRRVGEVIEIVYGLT